MYPIIGFLGIAFSLYLLSNYLTRRRQAKLAAEWGCQPPIRRDAKWPLGFDFVRDMIVADRTNNLPNYIEDVTEAMGVNTWSQVTAGTELLNTNEPKNVRLG